MTDRRQPERSLMKKMQQSECEQLFGSLTAGDLIVATEPGETALQIAVLHIEKTIPWRLTLSVVVAMGQPEMFLEQPDPDGPFVWDQVAQVLVNRHSQAPSWYAYPMVAKKQAAKGQAAQYRRVPRVVPCEVRHIDRATYEAYYADPRYQLMRDMIRNGEVKGVVPLLSLALRLNHVTTVTPWDLIGIAHFIALLRTNPDLPMVAGQTESTPSQGTSEQPTTPA